MDQPSFPSFSRLWSLWQRTAVFLCLGAVPACAPTQDPFFKVNNPFTFDEEAAAIREALTFAGPKSEEAESEDTGSPHTSAGAYFGGPPASTLTLDKPKLKKAAASHSALAESPRAEEAKQTRNWRGGGPFDSSANPSDTVNSREPEISLPRATTGPVCYRCNGKGTHLQPAGEAIGEVVVCPDCRGRGRL